MSRLTQKLSEASYTLRVAFVSYDQEDDRLAQ